MGVQLAESEQIPLIPYFSVQKGYSLLSKICSINFGKYFVVSQLPNNTRNCGEETYEFKSDTANSRAFSIFSIGILTSDAD